MDLKICGILDIIIVLIGIISIIIGYKKGFIKKILSLAGFVAVLILAFVYCTHLAEFLTEKEIIYPNIFNPVLENIQKNLEGAGILQDYTIEQAISIGLGVPEILSKLLVNIADLNGNVADISVYVADFIARIAMNIISFLIILIGSSLIILLLKLIITILRKIKIIRIIDGVLGSVLYFTIFLLFIYVGFTFVQIFMEQSWFSGAKEFLVVDMQLPVNGEDAPFRLSRFIYENNILYKIIELFLPQ